MKRKTAKEILAESFRELAESKPVDKITVPNIPVYIKAPKWHVWVKPENRRG